MFFFLFLIFEGSSRRQAQTQISDTDTADIKGEVRENTLRDPAPEFVLAR